MKSRFLLFTFFLLILIFVVAFFVIDFYPQTKNQSDVLQLKNLSDATWPIQSVDTMKFSRDASGQALKDPSFQAVIEKQVEDIANMHASHIAIATPYDDEFLPVIEKWVAAARKNHLKIWFRGNFSGWEGWFGHMRIDRDEHKAALQKFITNNPDLFQDGDVFSSCPECENGGPGDPRQTGDVTGFRQFLIDEYDIATGAFQKIHKNVLLTNSSNGDVAKLIMDPTTTQKLGGIVTVDHYVKTPQQLESNLHDLAKNSGGKIILGEMGVPIPDIHGKMTDQEQQAWIASTLQKLSDQPDVIGVNYWVSVGGSTALWNNDGTPRPAVETIHAFFEPPVLAGTVTDRFGKILEHVAVVSPEKTVYTDASGAFALVHDPQPIEVSFSLDGYMKTSQQTQPASKTDQHIILEPISPSLGFRFRSWLAHLFGNSAQLSH
jgi:hypothetical protein